MSRRKARYERRQEKRLNNLLARNINVGNLSDIFTFKKLYKAGKACCKGVRWKSSTKNFERHLFFTTARLRKEVLDGTWKPLPYTHFILKERGKVRPIDAPPIQDRQLHKLLTKEVLLKLYLPSMIWNNGASLEGKGFEFSKNELKKDLRRFCRKYGTDGNVVLIDFKQFFPSVPHDKIFERHSRYILQNEVRELTDVIVNSNNSDIGMPLGVEPSQAEMIAFPSALDNYLKCQLSLKYMGHYMDDYYILVPPTMDSKKILNSFIEKATDIGLKVSLSKTKIIPLSNPFRYCKAKYQLYPNGKVTVVGSWDSFKRARHKIKSFHKRIEKKLIDYQMLWDSINAIFAYYYKYNDHQRVLRLRRLFYSLFGFSSEKYKNFKKRGLTV